MYEDSTPKKNREVFRSRYSIVLILIIFISLIFIIIKLIQSPVIGLIIIFFVFVLIVSFVSGINYVIEDDQLIFRIWSIQIGKININSIEKVERSYIPLSSNAGSLKRLFGKTRKGAKIPLFLISPHNEERFLEKLKQINPNIKIKVENKTGFYRFWDWDI
jgi:hypothetical protein